MNKNSIDGDYTGQWIKSIQLDLNNPRPICTVHVDV